jgi:lipid-A-disaccharide synthase
MEVLTHIDRTASIGLVEAAKKVGFLHRVLRAYHADIRRGRYAGVVLIDYPDFNIQLAKRAHTAGVPVFYYIPPQTWAWRTYRVHALRRYVDQVIVVLPFEKEFYQKHGVNAEFFGHPLLDEIPLTGGSIPGRIGAPNESSGNYGSNYLAVGPTASPAWDSRIREEAGAGPGQTLIGVLPGSRKTEIRHILPVVAGACVRIQKEFPEARFVLPLARHLNREDIENMLQNYPIRITVVEGRTYEVMGASDFLIAKSGTTTLEALIQGTPMVIVYRGPLLSYLFARYLVRVRHVGLPNLLAGSGIVQELLQFDLTPDRLADSVIEYMKRPEEASRMRDELTRLRRNLGQPGVAFRAAKLILEKVFT